MFQSMRTLIAVVLIGLALVGCSTAAPGTDGAVVPGTQATALLPVVDLSKLMAVNYHRSGGLEGLDDRAQLFRDGRVVLERQGEAPVVFWLTADEIAQIDAAFEATDFTRRSLQEPTPNPPVPDALLYEITRRGLLVESTLRTHDGAVPAWAQPLLPLLDGLLLSPKPDRSQPASPTRTAEDQAEPGRVVLVELRRSGGVAGIDEQVLVNLDGSYSVARGGVVTTGQLEREELATLLGALEAVQLDERSGEYLPEDVCCDRMAYEVIYRNLVGSYKVDTMDGAVPEWLQPILDRMVATFLAPTAVVLQPTSAATAPAAEATPTRVAPIGAATATPTPRPALAPPTATPTPATVITEPPTVAPTAVPTVAPTVAPTTAPTVAPPVTAPSSALTAFYGELVAAGLTVEPTGARITKPYLAVPGTIVRVNGQPLQLFEYPDESVLMADVSGLAPDASSINGMPLAWQAAPHFWSSGRVLVLWVGDDPAYFATLSTVLGKQLAGR